MANRIKRCTSLTPVTFVDVFDGDDLSAIATNYWNSSWGLMGLIPRLAGSSLALTASYAAITGNLSFNFQNGRKYRVVCQIRAITTTAASNVQIQLHDGAAAISGSGTQSVWVGGNNGFVHAEFFIDGSGQTNTLNFKAAGANNTIFYDVPGQFYVEDIGPITRGSTGVVGPDWTGPDARYVNSSGDTMTGDLFVPDEAYGVSWNGAFDVPTKNAVYDKIETVSAGGGSLTADSVTNVYLANMTAPTLKGRNTAGTGDPEDLSPTTVTAMLNTFTPTLKGLVPPPTTPSTVKYLRDDGNWVTPPDTTGISQATADGLYINTTGPDTMTGLLTLTTNAVGQALQVNNSTDRGIDLMSANAGLRVMRTVSNNPYIEFYDNTGATNYGFIQFTTSQMFIAKGATILLTGTTTSVTANVPLLLTADPTAALGAVTKQYSDRLFSTTTTTLGAVPGSNNVGATYFLNAAGAWAVPAGGGGVTDGDKTDITVSASGATWTIDAGVVTLAKMANLAQDQFIGRVTASTGVPETATITAAARTVLDDTTVGAMVTTLGAQPANGNLSTLGGLATTTGNMILAAGSVWTSANPATVKTALAIASTDVSGLGSLATKSTITSAEITDLTIATADIANDAITYAKLQNISTNNRVLGLVTGAPADAIELTGTQVTTMLDNFTATLKGLAPPPTTVTNTKYLRDDGTWQVPPDTTGISQATADTLYDPIRQVIPAAQGTGVTSYTITLADENKLNEFTAATAITISVPTNATLACPIGYRTDFFQTGTGKITVAAVTPGTTAIIATPSAILRASGSAASLTKVGTDRWLLTGDLT